MAIHHITLNLTDDQEAFVKWLKERDRKYTGIRYTLNEEITMLAMCGIKEAIDSSLGDEYMEEANEKN